MQFDLTGVPDHTWIALTVLLIVQIPLAILVARKAWHETSLSKENLRAALLKGMRE